MKTLIPIVFTPDENFIVPTCVAILSMLRSKKKETQYKFYIVLSENFDEEKLVYLERVKALEKEFYYEVVRIDATIFDGATKGRDCFSNSMYYRLVLADCLTLDKCMYHDADILAFRDLSDMYDIDLSDYYVAAVKDGFNYHDVGKYIFSGDMVFNLKKIRHDGLTKEFISHIYERLGCPDQQILNRCCYGRTYFLPLKFCMIGRWFNNDFLEKKANRVYSQSEIIEAKTKPAVVHFAGGNVKPWNNVRVKYGSVWWNYAKEILTNEEYTKWRESAEKQTKERDWCYLSEKVKDYKSIIIFGCGKYGKIIFDALKVWNLPVCCFIDNDINKQGSIINGCSVLGIDEALTRYKDAFIINSIQLLPSEVKNQLLDKNVPDSRIFNFKVKDRIYYPVIDEIFRELEYRDILFRDFGWSID